MAFLIKGGNSADDNPDDQFLMQAEMRYAERMKKKSKYKGQIEVIFSGDDSIDTDYFACNDTLRYIEIEECVDTIFSAFNCCIALQRVIFPKTINYIWDYSFKDCESLKSIELPPHITEICDETFMDCKSLEYVFIPQGVTTIGDDAFSRCISLRQIYLPQSVRNIGRYAFEDCKNLERVEGGVGIKRIEYGAFSDCEKLKEFPFQSTIVCIKQFALPITVVKAVK